MLEGERWKNSRRFMLKTFRNLGMGKAGIQDRILHEAELLTDTLRKSNGEAYDPFSALSASVANVICTLCWNKRYEADDVVFRHILARLHSTSAYLVQAGPLLAYPSTTQPFLSENDHRFFLHKHVVFRRLKIRAGKVQTWMGSIYASHRRYPSLPQSHH
ncbi:hypothetical protein RvY_16945-3 [Ramazzottius varieornatus]|uniref:Cytochrome P450 n=1 Tax=Ramazzottius varieornatus TaxID=947166 RepID=A0A1D1W0D5_RAMVA|nr:hypothetical protein RvY_16945-3 [Ramazzottius varieornatus]